MSLEIAPARFAIGAPLSSFAVRAKPPDMTTYESSRATAKVRTTVSRGWRVASASTGAVVGWKHSWPTQWVGSPSMRRRHCSSSAVESTAVSIEWPPAIRELGRRTSFPRLAMTWDRPAASPHHHDGTDSSSRSDPSTVRRQCGQPRRQRRVLEHAGAERVDHAHRAGTTGVGQARHAEGGLGIQLEWIAEPSIEASQDDVYRHLLADAAQPHLSVANLEVAALHEGIAELAGDECMLEGRLRQRTGRQYDDGGIIDPGRRDCLQRSTKRPDERSQPVHVGVAEQTRKDPRQDPAILQRVGRPRRCLGAVADRPPVAVGATGEVDAVHDELFVAREPDSVAGPEERRIAQHQLGRDGSAAEELAFAVQIARTPGRAARLVGSSLSRYRPTRRSGVPRAAGRAPTGDAVDVGRRRRCR